MEPIAQDHRARTLWLDAMRRLQALLAGRGVHPACTVVLLPYAQLMPLARQAWASVAPSGFAPRFETTMNWAGAAGFEPGADDISFDMGRDLLTAGAWLERAGLGARSELLAGRLVEVAWQLAGAAAAMPRQGREDWARDARAVVGDGAETPLLALEAAVAAIGVAWAGASGYATDVLLRPASVHATQLLVLVEGLQADPMARALRQLFGDRSVTLALDAPADPGAVALHEAEDPAHEAEMAAACVVRHVEAGSTPVALVAIDRVLTRRVRAMLEARGLAIRDETGWKLSTTRAAAQVMAALRACAWDAPSDAVLDWLKNSPAIAPRTVSALERRLRREAVRDWRSLHAGAGPDRAPAAWETLVADVNRWREQMQASRPLADWLHALRELLQAAGQWSRLERDDAGVQLFQALGLQQAALQRWQALPHAQRRLGPADFHGWVGDTLEAASFRPAHPASEQVVILPLSQVLARPFGAAVLAGCDELRLPGSPEPPGRWTAAQRAGLGLPSRPALEAELRASWRCALQVPRCDVLWRRSDEAGEAVLPSPLVQALRFDAGAALAQDPRALRELTAVPVPRPLPAAPALAVQTLSASGYEDLRHCPYRFHALRQLGLQEAAEIDGDLGKRDFGSWLHKVLGRFHETLRDTGGIGDARQLDRAAQEVTSEIGLDEGEFLPFAATWPATRDGYLAWLDGYLSREGAVFSSAETPHERLLGSVTLVGRLDRIDRLPDGSPLVLDYKTEAQAKTVDRVRQPGEDTQLAFYAALLQEPRLRAGYVNVGERGKTCLVEQREIGRARELLEQGIEHDLQRLAAGAALPALGEGPVCGFCAARGVCRRDFWT